MPDSSAKNRPKRSRTGCFKCRSRRRKCDERKPKCQNCIDREFECHYGPRFSFLKKNTLTVSESGTPARYSNVQFENQTRTPPEEIVTANSPQSQSPLASEREAQIANAELSPHRFPLHETEQQIQDGHLVDLPSSPNFSSLRRDPSQNDETVLGALLALANQSAEILSPNSTDFQHYYQSDEAQTISQASGRSLQITSPSVGLHSGTSLHDTGGFTQWPDHALSSDLALRLLRHFRYNIAPWLDISDMSQQFGLVGTRAVLQSDRVRLALQALSAVSMLADSNNKEDVSQLNQLVSLAVVHERDHPENGQDHLLASIFNRTRHHLSDIQHGWVNLPAYHGSGLAAFSSQPWIGALHAALWSLAARLELSASLIKEMPIRYGSNSEIHRQGMSSSSPIASKVFHCAQEPLRLCIEAANFCWDENRDRLVSIGNWKSIVESLNVWYTNRPIEFQPMVQWDDSRSTFPLWFFTTGGGLFANQLYHTAMLLLLQNKPKTVRLPHRQPSLASPLWHAQRTCGIALNNDRRECWDFCLLASLFVAAKTMTHEAQQLDILRGLERIQALTGWSVSYFTTSLRKYWHLSSVD